MLIHYGSYSVACDTVQPRRAIPSNLGGGVWRCRMRKRASERSLYARADDSAASIHTRFGVRCEVDIHADACDLAWKRRRFRGG